MCFIMKQLDIIIPHERVSEINRTLTNHKVVGIMFYVLREEVEQHGKEYLSKLMHNYRKEGCSRIWISNQGWFNIIRFINKTNC